MEDQAESHPEKQQSHMVPDLIAGAPATCFKAELAYFDSKPMIQTCIESSDWITQMPTTAIENFSHLAEWDLEPMEGFCIDPTTIRLTSKLSIKRGDGTPVGPFKEKIPLRKEGDPPHKPVPAAYDPVCLTCSPLDTLIARMEIMMNRVPINSNCAEYHYRSIFERSLNYSASAKHSILAPSGFINGNTQNGLATFLGNMSLHQRGAWTQNGQKYHVSSKISHDLANQAKLLLPRTRLTLRCQRMRPGVGLMVDPMFPYHKGLNYLIYAEDLKLEYLRLKLSPPAISYLETSLATKAAKFHLTRAELQHIPIPGMQGLWNV